MTGEDERQSARQSARQRRADSRTRTGLTRGGTRTVHGPQHDPHRLASARELVRPLTARGRGPRAPTAKARHTTRRARARQRSPINSPIG